MNGLSVCVLFDVMFVYALKDPRSQNIRYVGITKDVEKRLKQHLYYAKCGQRSHKASWIREVLAAGSIPQIEILDTVDHDEAAFWEIEWIRLLGALGSHLTNQTRGGDGLVDLSPEAKARQDSKRWGRKHSAEACEKIRKARTGSTQSEQARLKISQANRGRKDSMETRAKKSLAKKGAKFSVEHRKKLSVSRLNRLSARNTSGFVGVSINPRSHKWQAVITVPGGRRLNCGEYHSVEDAVLVQRLSMFKHYG